MDKARIQAQKEYIARISDALENHISFETLELTDDEKLLIASVPEETLLLIRQTYQSYTSSQGFNPLKEKLVIRAMVEMLKIKDELTGLLERGYTDSEEEDHATR